MKNIKIDLGITIEKGKKRYITHSPDLDIAASVSAIKKIKKDFEKATNISKVLDRLGWRYSVVPDRPDNEGYLGEWLSKLKKAKK